MAELDLDYLCNGLAPLTREMPPNVRAKGAFYFLKNTCDLRIFI